MSSFLVRVRMNASSDFQGFFGNKKKRSIKIAIHSVGIVHCVPHCTARTESTEELHARKHGEHFHSFKVSSTLPPLVRYRRPHLPLGVVELFFNIFF